MKKELDAFAAGYYGKFKVHLLLTKLLIEACTGLLHTLHVGQ